MAIFLCKILAMASGKAERGKTYEEAPDKTEKCLPRVKV